MPADLNDIRGKLTSAVRTLALEDAPLYERLADAYTQSLADLADAELPAEIRDDVAFIKRTMTMHATGSHEGDIPWAASALGGQDVAAVADRVFSLFTRVSGMSG